MWGRKVTKRKKRQKNTSAIGKGVTYRGIPREGKENGRLKKGVVKVFRLGEKEDEEGAKKQRVIQGISKKGIDTLRKDNFGLRKESKRGY